MLGLKLFIDTPQTLAFQIIERARHDGLGVEILLLDGSGKAYRADGMSWLLNETPYAAIPCKVLHLDHVRSQGCNILNPETRGNMLAEMGDAQYLGICQAVMHYHHDLPFDQRHPAVMARNMAEINAVAKDHGITVHIENTLFDMNGGAKADPANTCFYRQMFDEVLDGDLDHLGFCFDLGHAKTFSTETLATWLLFLDGLRDHGIPLHFHLHNNGGEKDEHLSFRLADLRSLNEGDAFSGGRHYVDVVADILEQYPGMKLLEVGAAEAIPGLDWIQEQINWRSVKRMRY